jgi:hypothetical protein
MLEPWAKRAFTYAALATVTLSAALAGYVYHLRRLAYDNLEQRQGVIETIRFTQTGVGGQHTRMRTLVLTVRPLDGPHAESQELTTGATIEKASEYFQHHHPGDHVLVWVHRKSGRIDDVMLPAPPDFRGMFLILLPFGLLTTFAFVAALGHRAHRQTSRET